MSRACAHAPADTIHGIDASHEIHAIATYGRLMQICRMSPCHFNATADSRWHLMRIQASCSALKQALAGAGGAVLAVCPTKNSDSSTPTPSCGGAGPWPACAGVGVSVGHMQHKQGNIIAAISGTEQARAHGNTSKRSRGGAEHLVVVGKGTWRGRRMLTAAIPSMFLGVPPEGAGLRGPFRPPGNNEMLSLTWPWLSRCQALHRRLAKPACDSHHPQGMHEWSGEHFTFNGSQASVLM